jgi:hypothetical protein
MRRHAAELELHSAYNKSVDSHCAYHPTNMITCVCINRNVNCNIARCIMPLCVRCIDTHLQQHQKRHSKSQLVPVEECLWNAKESLLNLLGPLKSTLMPQQ